MTTYTFRNGQWIDKATGEPAPRSFTERKNSITKPKLCSDIPAYKSPIGGYVVEGRAARREDLKRNNCREVDPTENRVAYSEEFAKKKGLPMPEKEFKHLFR